MRRALVWSAAALSLASTLILVYCCQSPPRVQVGSDWTPERLHAELGKLGEVWEARSGPGGSLLLRRPECGKTWSEVEEMASFDPERFIQHPGCLSVQRMAFVRDLSPEQATLPPGRLQIGPLLIQGKPSELRHLLTLFSP